VRDRKTCRWGSYHAINHIGDWIMNKSLFTLILVCLSTSALAEWNKVGEDTDSTIYADASTIRKKGDVAKMWSLYDFKETQKMSGKDYLSMEIKYEFDCVKEQSMTTYILYYAGNMGGGEKGAFTYPPKQWQPITPKSTMEELWKAACSKQ